MNSWVSVFSQSPANNASYDGDRLPEQIWQWGRGFKPACVICASAARETRKLLAFAVTGPIRIAEIDRPLFWQGLTRLDPAIRDLWLSRWIFADRSVKRLRQTAERVEHP